ncbi:MAG: hypothetical protein PF483_03540 [Halothiobacillus sp.]|nr:hypothetical protein [Halothiobacillus sp.]
MMLHDGQRMVVISNKISRDVSGVLTAQIGKGKYIVPLRSYQVLCKIEISVISETQLPALEKTMRLHYSHQIRASSRTTVCLSRKLVLSPSENDSITEH